MSFLSRRSDRLEMVCTWQRIDAMLELPKVTSLLTVALLAVLFAPRVILLEPVVVCELLTRFPINVLEFPDVIALPLSRPTQTFP